MDPILDRKLKDIEKQARLQCTIQVVSFISWLNKREENFEKKIRLLLEGRIIIRIRARNWKGNKKKMKYPSLKR